MPLHEGPKDAAVRPLFVWRRPERSETLGILAASWSWAGRTGLGVSGLAGKTQVLGGRSGSAVLCVVMLVISGTA